MARASDGLLASEGVPTVLEPNHMPMNADPATTTTNASTPRIHLTGESFAACGAAMGVGDQHRSAFSYVDYDEIDGLMGGIDFMGKGEGNASALPNYEAQFRTRSNLEVVSFDNNNQRMISVRAVQVIFPSGEVTW